MIEESCVWRRCFRCYGAGKIPTGSPHYVGEHLVLPVNIPCPDCDGRGYVQPALERLEEKR